MKPVNKKLRQAWYGMMHRCNDKKDIGYRRYGGRGIKVCDRWLKYENFCEDMSESFQKHLLEHGPRQTTIDRIDSNGNYSKENCRWATYKTQQNNRSNNHIITIDGVSRSIMEWSRAVGVNKDLIYGRISRGWSEERAVTTPPMTDNSENGRIGCMKRWGKSSNTNPQ